MAAALRSLRLRPAAVDRVLNGQNGPVGHAASRLGGYVTREAQSLARQRLSPRQGPRELGGRKRYRDSFRTTTLHGADGPRAVITNSAPHATFIENGTRPHEIRPRHARVLVFVVPGSTSAGSVVFTKRVQHPGTQPYRIMADALRIGTRKAGF